MPSRDMHDVEAIKKAADICGSLSKLAIAIGANYTSVFKWAHGKTVPTPLNCMRIEKATRGKVKKEEIRPNFDWKNFKLI
ncbi:MAG: helix-turn-helix domain-containing protein [Alphaproteobacteria bacterium]|nr:helix-turn-helix domain-containing protein [Alphaproteobacteria bacterium]